MLDSLTTADVAVVAGDAGMTGVADRREDASEWLHVHTWQLADDTALTLC